VLWLLTQAYPDAFCFASWQVRLATAHCTEADSKGYTNRPGSLECISTSSSVVKYSQLKLNFMLTRPSLTSMYVTWSWSLYWRTECAGSEQLSWKSLLAEQPSSRPKGNGTAMFPQWWEQFSFSAFGLYPAYMKKFKLLKWSILTYARVDSPIRQIKRTMQFCEAELNNYRKSKLFFQRSD